MKNTFTLLALLAAFTFVSCKKEYVCVCTNTVTGEKSYGDPIKTAKYAKKGYEETCKSNEEVYNDLKDCHLEE